MNEDSQPHAMAPPGPSGQAPDRGVQVVCTLAEGSYFCGAAALLNSLVRAGFRGEVVVGFRGGLPPWLAELHPTGAPFSYAVTESVSLRLVEMPGPWHLNNLKPRLIGQIFSETDAAQVIYLDTDIVIDGDWQTIAGWAREDVLLVLDIANTAMPPEHVYRRAWTRLAASRGYSCRPVTGYVNGGCIGVPRVHSGFAVVWADLMDALAAEGVDMSRIRYDGGRLEFTSMDQDVLNATVMATEAPVALLGYEAMGVFPRRDAVMPHAMFGRKPWLRNYILDALRGLPPGRVHLTFWNYVDGPIHPFGRLELARKRVSLAIGRMIGLLHVRVSREL